MHHDTMNTTTSRRMLAALHPMQVRVPQELSRAARIAAATDGITLSKLVDAALRARPEVVRALESVRQATPMPTVHAGDAPR
jgi:hypothetical protein